MLKIRKRVSEKFKNYFKMKKVLILTLIMLCALSNMKAQLKMSSANGNICVAATPVPVSNVKFQVLSTTAVNNTWSYATTSSNTNMIGGAGSYCVGSQGATSFSSVMGGQSWGVYGTAGNATSGYNYGVFGILGGTNNGAGVFGSARGFGSTNTNGNWAGYFNGDVKITNPLGTATLWVNSTQYTSDQRLKKNITTLTNTIFDKISQLNAVQFQYKTRSDMIAAGLIPADTSQIDTVTNINANKVRYGYIAQDVQQIFPDIVYQGSDGFLGVDYVELIPLMIEAIKQQTDSMKQQNTKINNLQQQLNKCCNIVSPNTGSPDGNKTTNTGTGLSAMLYQNVPNPFSQTTMIKCFIPDNAMLSNIYIYDMQGTQIKKIQINGKGDESISIQGSELRAGMYMYTLIIDGKEIDTRKMILTD
jgi:hypothetical protein